MKKSLCVVMVAGLFSGCLNAEKANKSMKLVSIDSIELMQKSKEGNKLAEELQKEIAEFQKFVKKNQEEVLGFQETVAKQAKVLSKDALMEKGEKLEKMKKTATREMGDREESLKLEIQKKQFALRERQMKVASKVFEKEQWGLMIDRNTPGVLFVANAIDKTDLVLKAVDEEFDQTLAKNIVEKETTKTVVPNKTTKSA